MSFVTSILVQHNGGGYLKLMITDKLLFSDAILSKTQVIIILVSISFRKNENPYNKQLIYILSKKKCLNIFNNKIRKKCSIS